MKQRRSRKEGGSAIDRVVCCFFEKRVLFNRMPPPTPHLGHRLAVAVIVVLGQPQRRGDPADVQGVASVRDVDVRGHGRDAVELDPLGRRLDGCVAVAIFEKEGQRGRRAELTARGQKGDDALRCWGVLRAYEEARQQQ